MSVLDSLPLGERPTEYRPARPPTAIYPDLRQVARWRDAEFPATSLAAPRVVRVNLEGALLTPAALQELVLPVARGIREGVYGPLVLIVVTPDEATVGYLDWLAQCHEVSFFVTPSTATPLDEARPVGALTRTDKDTLDLVTRAGGTVTSSGLAGIGGIEVNAAVNRLAKLARKGFVQRVARTRREGDIYSDVRVAAERIRCASISSTGVSARSEQPVAEFILPDSLRRSVEELAQREGADPGELVIRAWHEFAHRNRERLDAESDRVGLLMSNCDIEGLASYLNPHARQRAEDAARRARH